MDEFTARLRGISEQHGCRRTEEVRTDSGGGFVESIPGRFGACDECVERARCDACDWKDVTGFGKPRVLIPGIACPRHRKTGA